MKRTWGTEPSKYPEEKKSTDILLVAASESGWAWYDLAWNLVEQSGKIDHRRW